MRRRDGRYGGGRDVSERRGRGNLVAEIIRHTKCSSPHVAFTSALLSPQSDGRSTEPCCPTSLIVLLLLTAAVVSLLGGGMMLGAPARSPGRPPIAVGPAFSFALIAWIVSAPDATGMPGGGRGDPVVVCWTPAKPA